MSTINRKAIRARVHTRIRKKLAGTPERPRLAVNFSNQHVYAQVIDDTKGVTLCSACTKQLELKKANLETAAKVGALVGERALAAGITEGVFDRGGFLYPGKGKALADAAREAGLKF